MAERIYAVRCMLCQAWHEGATGTEQALKEEMGCLQSMNRVGMRRMECGGVQGGGGSRKS